MEDYALDPTGCVEKSEMVARITDHCLPSAECYVCLEAYSCTRLAVDDKVILIPSCIYY
jgi:hypothetical protein